MQPSEPHDGHVAVPVQAGKYTVLTVEFPDAQRTLAVVLPHPPVQPELASMVAYELAKIHKLVTGWNKDVPRSDSQWSVQLVGEYVELYVPPEPGDREGIVMGLDADGTLQLIEGLAQALARLRAERKVAGR